MAVLTPVFEHRLEREIAQCIHHEGRLRTYIFHSIELQYL